MESIFELSESFPIPYIVHFHHVENNKCVRHSAAASESIYNVGGGATDSRELLIGQKICVESVE